MGGDAAGLKLAGLVVAWLGGVLLQTTQPQLWPPQAYLAGMALGLVLLASAAAVPRSAPGGGGWPRLACRATGLLLLAFASTGWRASQVLAEALPQAAVQRDVVAEGTVTGLPRRMAGGLQFGFEVDRATLDGEPVAVPRRLLLGWYAGRDDADDGGPALPALATRLQSGERWRFSLRLKPPHGLANPHGFDRELWLFEQRIRATGSVREAGPAAPQRLQAAPVTALGRWRQEARDAVLLQVPDSRAAGVLAALAVGDQAAIEPADWALFRDTGVAHLMSISGLHVTMFAWLATGLVGAGWRRSPRLMQLAAMPHAARWGGVLAAAAYAAFAGWGVPAQRTVWMLATAALLASGRLRWPPLLVLLAAAAVVSVADPWALLQPGFWLSFVAVGLLMLGGDAPARAHADRESASDPAAAADIDTGLERPPPASAWRRLLQATRQLLHTQAVATLGLAPLTLVFFQQLSLVGFVANLVAIPVVTLLITPLALLGLLWPPLWDAGAAVLQLLIAGLGHLPHGPDGVFIAAVAPAWARAAGLLGGLLLLPVLPLRLRLLGLALLLPLLWPAVPRPAEGRFEALAADVGQGSAVLVRTRHHLLLYDTGPTYGPGADAGGRVLLPLLRARGERRIHLLVLSHRDSDHVGGAASLRAAMPVDRLLSSLDEGHALRDGPQPHARCAAGQRWQWDGVRFELLHPPPPPAPLPARPNARSCVLRVEDAQGRSLLLAGDIEAAEEAQLVATQAAALRSDVLLVPHHGSRTSSTPAFLDAVAPRVAVVQAGHLNRHGHPHDAVLARYTARGVQVTRSDTCGAWAWREGAMTCERQSSPQYWRRSTPSR
ncbi:DNA internalization-related competence protein ComEC/Rec2 [Aquincola tertiaricarbonis]|uniref:DNA internalization-related competence protein ComEC/Rec2 n=1 Tax=Aquincola tertiaricarbonis TaxID=391953 RepID=UPI00061517B5|nr:DNA internalization-related competence protein ComEC/Rec2 [Aquincola tertiaricarbonis]